MTTGPGDRARRALLLVVLAVLLGGCASFPDTPSDWHDLPPIGPEHPPQPQLPDTAEPRGPAPPGPAGGPPPPSGPCVDPDPQVVASCLGPISAVVPLPGGEAALAAERTTGRIVRVARGQAPVTLATVPVAATGDGGLTGLALSPDYAEDQLVYAYATTGGGGSVLRVAQGDVPKPVLTGIPGGGRGALGVGPDGALLVATGDGGDPAAAGDPASLAGKLLRIDPFGRPAPGNPNPASPVVGSGVHSPGGVCTDASLPATFVTDRAGPRDVLLAQRPGAPLGAEPVWTWPERPGVAGCAANGGQLLVALTGPAALYALHATPTGFVGPPDTVPTPAYGRLRGLAFGADGMLWGGTANKDGGTPGRTDDRVVRIQPPSGGGGAGSE